ncbi:hypothetical protein M2140_000413 [Clostridiales Family XIII bacterium PM5-7]
MLCSNCGKETVQGYLKSSRNIYFGTVKAADFSFEEKEISLGHFWKETDIECFHCADCNLFFFYYSKQD